MVLTGSVGLYKDNQQLQTRVKVNDLRPGESFGLPDESHNGLRSTSAQAMEDTRLLLLPHSIYLEATNLLHLKNTKRALSLLKAMPLFTNTPTDHLEKIASESLESKTQSGELIVRQGEMTRRFYIVISGTVKLLRLIEGRKLLVIDVLEAGDVFGDVAALRRSELQYSVLCTSACVCLSVDRELMSGLEGIHRVAKPYPSDQKLLEMLTERQRWKQFKRRVVSNAHRERQLSKVTWSSLLRSPAPDRKATHLPQISWRHHVSLI